MIRKETTACSITELLFSYQLYSLYRVMAFGQRMNPKISIIWSCKKEYGKDNVLWLVEWGDNIYIKVFDQRIPASYSIFRFGRSVGNWEFRFCTGRPICIP
nr:putative integron gene cassette protein [uncultured bacterium]